MVNKQTKLYKKIIMEITIDQIKAARALLDWTQDDLASISGLSKASIQNYEIRRTEPNSTSLYKIIDAFESHGLEFIEEGVRRKILKTKTYRGQRGFVDFMNLDAKRGMGWDGNINNAIILIKKWNYLI